MLEIFLTLAWVLAGDAPHDGLLKLFHHRPSVLHVHTTAYAKGETVALTCMDSVVAWGTVTRVKRGTTDLRHADQAERVTWASDPMKPSIELCGEPTDPTFKL